MSLEMAHKVIVPQKKIMSRSFLNSGTLIVINAVWNFFKVVSARREQKRNATVKTYSYYALVLEKLMVQNIQEDQLCR